MNLTKNFQLDEFLISETAGREGFNEQFTPPQHVIDSLKILCENILQPLREALPNGVIKVSSGWRCQRLNEHIGSKPNSDHLKGFAADVNYFEGTKELNVKLFNKVLELNLPFKQMIKEYGTASHPAWIHLSYDPSNIKREVLRKT
jgi:zinc D-Ala-D-Ala carboxypeptidase